MHQTFFVSAMIVRLKNVNLKNRFKEKHMIVGQGRRRGVFKVFTEYLNIFNKGKKNDFSSFENLEKENRLRGENIP